MSSQKYQVASLLLIICLLFSQSKGCDQNVVEIRNELGPGRLLEFHCHSEDDDLGDKTMQFKATPYQIRFHDAFGLFTRWNCLLRQGPKMEYSFDVEVYKEGYIPRCGQLRIWSARVDGIYFARDANVPLRKALDWKKS